MKKLQPGYDPLRYTLNGLPMIMFCDSATPKPKEPVKII